jgi:glyoxylase-like metal-dependent hydrolase (beta-lactamase superfamily II)
VTKALTRVSEHVYWFPPGPPDRPSLCAVAGERRTVMLDGGSSRAHARSFLDALSRAGVETPSLLVYTHSHWDHVFGGVEVAAPVIAHATVAERLVELAARDWSDDGLDRRVAAGEASPEHAQHVKEELPAPRSVDIVLADVVFHDPVRLELGGVAVHVRHVGGDHSPDSTVVHVEPDRLLFLGDCICESPLGALTAERSFRLHDVLRSFGAELYVEGHHSAVVTRAEFEELLDKMRRAEQAVREGRTIEDADEDTADFLEAFGAGLSAGPQNAGD